MMANNDELQMLDTNICLFPFWLQARPWIIATSCAKVRCRRNIVPRCSAGILRFFAHEKSVTLFGCDSSWQNTEELKEVYLFMVWLVIAFCTKLQREIFLQQWLITQGTSWTDDEKSGAKYWELEEHNAKHRLMTWTATALRNGDSKQWDFSTVSFVLRQSSFLRVTDLTDAADIQFLHNLRNSVAHCKPMDREGMMQLSSQLNANLERIQSFTRRHSSEMTDELNAFVKNFEDKRYYRNDPAALMQLLIDFSPHLDCLRLCANNQVPGSLEVEHVRQAFGRHIGEFDSQSSAISWEDRETGDIVSQYSKSSPDDSDELEDSETSGSESDSDAKITAAVHCSLQLSESSACMQLLEAYILKTLSEDCIEMFQKFKPDIQSQFELVDIVNSFAVAGVIDQNFSSHYGSQHSLARRILMYMVENGLESPKAKAAWLVLAQRVSDEMKFMERVNQCAMSGIFSLEKAISTKSHVAFVSMTKFAAWLVRTVFVSHPDIGHKLATQGIDMIVFGDNLGAVRLGPNTKVFRSPMTFLISSRLSPTITNCALLDRERQLRELVGKIEWVKGFQASEFAEVSTEVARAKQLLCNLKAIWRTGLYLKIGDGPLLSIIKSLSRTYHSLLIQCTGVSDSDWVCSQRRMVWIQEELAEGAVVVTQLMEDNQRMHQEILTTSRTQAADSSVLFARLESQLEVVKSQLKARKIEEKVVSEIMSDDSIPAYQEARANRVRDTRQATSSTGFYLSKDLEDNQQDVAVGDNHAILRELRSLRRDMHSDAAQRSFELEELRSEVCALRGDPEVVKNIQQRAARIQTTSDSIGEPVALDQNSSGTLSPLVSSLMKQVADGALRRNDQYLRQVFDSHKDCETGYMYKIGFRPALEDLGIPFVDAEVDMLFPSHDEAPSKCRIDFEVFKKAVQKPDSLEQWARSIPLWQILSDAIPKKDNVNQPMQPHFFLNLTHCNGQVEPLKVISSLSKLEVDAIGDAFLVAFKQLLVESSDKLAAAFHAMDQKSASPAENAGSKFEMFAMNCGRIEDFHEGLYSRVGAPHGEFYKTMEAEHCSYAGCDREFTTANYSVTTTPKKEWTIIVDQDYSSADMRNGRRRVVIKELMRLDLARIAKLQEFEVLAVVLYTGPMFSVYNTILRRWPEDEYGVREKEENLFTTTIHVLVSAVQKIARVMPLPEGLVLYRGLGGNVQLPDHFFQPDSNGCCGFAEWAFMSTTSDKSVAILYSGIKEKRPLAVLFEMRVSAVDRGACIQEFSQYPKEVEYLWVPCSFLEPFGMQYLEVTEHGVLQVIPVRVNANLNTRTVEQLVNQKKSMHLDSFKFLLGEVRMDLDRIAREQNAEARLKKDASSRKGRCNVHDFLQRILKQCYEVFDRHNSISPAEYSKSEIFRGLVIEMLEVKSMSISKLHFWLSDMGQYLMFLTEKPLRIAHRGRVAFLHRTLPAGDSLQPAALALSRIIGLVQESVDEKNDIGEVRIISAAAEGMSAKYLTLLVHAGADVNTAEGKGYTALIRAALSGHVDTVRDLIRLGANVDQRNMEGDTALLLAAQEGHTDCVQALGAEGADPNVSSFDGSSMPLALAAQNGHAQCLRVLGALRADVNARLPGGATALHFAVQHGRLDCIQVLYELRADLNAATKNGSTPTMLADNNKQIACLRLLQQLGAELDGLCRTTLAKAAAAESAAAAAAEGGSGEATIASTVETLVLATTSNSPAADAKGLGGAAATEPDVGSPLA